MISEKEYSEMTEKSVPKSPVLKDCLWAFFVGGTICSAGQLFFEIFVLADIPEKTVKCLVSMTLIFIAVLLTGLGIFDKIAKHAGAGTLVPITGFANAMASPAIEFKSEGYILGLGAKMFTIAGPVIVYGVSASVIYGIIFYILN